MTKMRLDVCLSVTLILFGMGIESESCCFNVLKYSTNIFQEFCRVDSPWLVKSGRLRRIDYCGYGLHPGTAPLTTKSRKTNKWHF